MPARFVHPYVLLTLASLFWSGNMVIGRAIRHDAPPFAIAFWRWIIVLSLTLPFALPHLKAQWPLIKRHWKVILFLGLLGVSGYNTLAYIALQYTAATNAVLLNSFIPVATIALAWAVLNKPLSRIEWLGVLISLLGVTIIVCRGDLTSLASLRLNIGDIWMLVAVSVWALYTIGLQFRPAGMHPMLLLAAITVVGIIGLIPFYVWEISAGRHFVLTGATVSGIAYIGSIAGFLGYVCYNRGVAEVGPGKASLFIHLMPVFGTILSAIFLGERPHLFHIFGMAFIFSGIYLTTSYRRRA